MSNDPTSNGPGEMTLERRMEQLSPAKRALLEQQLRARSGAAAPIGRRPDATPAPASFSQELLWHLDRAMPGQYAYNVSRALRLSGTLDDAVLQRAVDALVARHEVLRTTFGSVEGEVVQLVAPPAPVAIEAVDLRAADTLGSVAALEHAIAERARRPFDLAHEAPFRVTLFALGGDEHVLLWVSHHVALDGWSATLMFEELAALYRAVVTGKASPLGTPAVRFGDFAAWQRESLSGTRLESLLGYWRERLADAPDLLALPTDRPRPAAPSFAGGQVATVLPPEMVTQLRELGSRYDATLYMVLVAAYVSLLHRYSGMSDIVIGSPVAGRTRAETERVVGYFANTLVHRNDLSGDPTFAELLGRVRRTALGAIEHQDVPLEKLIMEVRAGGAASDTQLFQCVLTMEDAPPAPIDVGELTIEPIELDSSYAGSAKFDLLLLVGERSQGLRLLLQYRSDLFDAVTGERMLGHLRTLLEGVIANADRPLSMLPLMSAAEQGVIEQANAHGIALDGVTIPARFAAQAARTPDAVALVCGNERLSYAELRSRARALASRLRAAGITSGDRVAITLERSAEMIVAILGIFDVGAAYVPILPDLPAERAARQAADAGVRAVITRRGVPAVTTNGIARIDIDIDIDAATADERALDAAAPVDSGSLAYILFTSGSTGAPKGVEVTHANLASYTSAILSRLAPPAGSAWRYATVSTLGADLGHTAVFPALTVGGALHVVPEAVAMDGARFAEYVRDAAIDVLKITPSHVRALLAGVASERDILPREWLVLGGEALRWDLAERLLAHGRCRVLNHYGPTEATVGAATFDVTRESMAGARAAGAESVPIGYPLPNAQLHVLGPNRERVPIRVAGELYVTGAGVAKGYVGQDALTRDRFVVIDGERAYRTGDRVRRLVDGAIEFLGRTDDQVKVRGYRVELEEIEHVLGAHEQVAQCVVLPVGDATSADVLAAFVVPRASGYAAAHADRVTPEALGEWLARRLPGYMIPASIRVLDVLPLTPNGKIDRRALCELASASSADATAPAALAPTTDTEIALAAIWSEVLKRGEIGVNDSFLDLGGHSLLAIRVLGKMSRQFGVRLPLRTLFDAPTIAQLAERVDAAVAAAASPSPGV